MDYLLALDQGTTSSRAMLFNRHGQVLAQAQRPSAQHFPDPAGWNTTRPRFGSRNWLWRRNVCKKRVKP